jgi:uncharacterized protein YihD (DUF1040 family)
MIRSVIVVLLWFFMIPLYAQTGGNDQYKQMLSSLEKTRSLSQEQVLQKLLLKKLIAFKDDNVTVLTSSKPVKNLTQYTQLFTQYLHSLQMKNEINQKLKSLSAQIMILKSGVDNNSSDAILSGLQSAYYAKIQQSYLKQLKVIDLDLTLMVQSMDKALGRFSIDQERLRRTQNRLDEK